MKRKPGPPAEVWPDDQTALLHDTSLSHREVSELIGRPLQSVARRRQQLGIQSVKVNRDWTDAEYAQLWDTSLSIREVAKRIGRTPGACQRKADLLGIGPRRVWGQRVLKEKQSVRQSVSRADGHPVGRALAFTPAEDAVLRELNWQVPLKDMTETLGRSEAAVGKRLHRLGLRKGFPTGEQHHWWCDGASQNPAYGWRGEDWPEVRQSVMARDGFTCQDGGEFIPSGSGLVVHHRIPYRLRPVNDFAWLVTLCVSHHMRRPEHQWAEIPEHIAVQLGRLAGGELSV